MDEGFDRKDIMTVRHIRSYFLALLVCSTTALAPPVMATAGEKQPATSLVLHLPGSKDGKSFLETVLQRVQSMPYYHFDSSLTCYVKTKPVTETGRFYFKSPNLVRFEAISAGALSGSIVVRQPDGKVRAKSGSFFGMTMGLSPSSKLLQTPNGYNILNSDFASLLESLLKSIEGNLKCMVTDGPAPYPGLDRAYTLEVIRDPDSVVQRIVLDSQSKLPLEWSIFNGDRLFSVLRIEKLSGSPVPSEDIFRLDAGGPGAKSVCPGEITGEKIRETVSQLPVDLPLSISVMAQARSALKDVESQCDSLEQELPAPEDKNVLKQNSGATARESLRQKFIGSAATIESIDHSLRKLEKSFQSIEEKAAAGAWSVGGPAGGTALTRAWHDDVLAIDNATGRLFEILRDDRPDLKAVAPEARKIRAQARALAAVLDQLSRV
jgi:hypothetical protein